VSIQKRVGKRGTSYRVEYRGNSQTVDTLEEARALDAKWKNAAAEGVPVVLGKLTLGEWLGAWIERHDAAPSTLRGYRGIVEHHLAPAIGNVRLRDMHAGTWRGYAAKKRDTLSGTTLLQHYRVLHKALEDAKSERKLAYNPLDQVKAPRKARTERAYFTADELAKLLKAAKGTAYYIPAVLGASLGLRLSEVLALRWSDLDLDAGLVVVRHSLDYHKGEWRLKDTKGGEITALSLSARTVAVLKAHRKAQKERRIARAAYWVATDLVNCNEIGEPLHPDTFSGGFGALCRGLKMTATFHGLRHSHATLLLAAGVPLKDVSARLRHSTTALTGDIYGHVLPQSEQRIKHVVEDQLGL